jgi:hypothetical protein
LFFLLLPSFFGDELHMEVNDIGLTGMFGAILWFLDDGFLLLVLGVGVHTRGADQKIDRHQVPIVVNRSPHTPYTSLGNLETVTIANWLILAIFYYLFDVWLSSTTQLVHDLLEKLVVVDIVRIVCDSHWRHCTRILLVLKNFVYFTQTYICYTFAYPTIPIHRIGCIKLNTFCLHRNRRWMRMSFPRKDIEIIRIRCIFLLFLFNTWAISNNLAFSILIPFN